MKRILKKFIKSDSLLYLLIVDLKHRYQKLRGLRHDIQYTRTDPDYHLIRLGSKHCGWTYVDDPSLHQGIILSAGLGEDGSFETEFAARHEATVHIIDPTPRAVHHFGCICERLGRSREVTYSETGTQPIESYDLSNVAPDQLRLHEVALWNERKRVKFFLPKDASHVSHSIVNFQNGYVSDTPWIEVDAIPAQELLEQIGITSGQVVLMKLDIEGAEIEVIEHLLATNFLPRQLLVEFDEFNIPTKRGLARIDHAHNLLTAHGYNVIHTDGQANFLYIRNQSNA